MAIPYEQLDPSEIIASEENARLRIALGIDPAPVAEEVAPVAEEVAPVAEEAAPVAEEAAPVAEDPATEPAS